MVDGILLTKFDTVDDKVRHSPYNSRYLRSSVWDYSFEMLCTRHELPVSGWSGTQHDIYNKETGGLHWNWTEVPKP